MRNIDRSEIYRSEYREWKLEALDESGYFIIFQGFLENELLNKISGNALKLYIYLGINSDNFNGIVWHSTKKIAKYFKKAERTIRTWIKELEDLNLIERFRLEYNGVIYTHLRPYKYKKDKKLSDIEYIIGELIIDESNLLYIKGIVSPKVMLTTQQLKSLEVYNKELNLWIKAKVMALRDNLYNIYSQTYILKDLEGNIYNIKNDKLLIRIIN